MTRPAVVLSLAFGLACAGAPTHPWQGDAAFTAGLQGSGPTAAVDGPRIVDRLTRAGVEAELTVDAPDRLTLSVSGARDSALVREAVAQGVLQIGPVETGVSNAHLADAALVTDEISGRPVAHLTLTEAGATRLCELSRAHVEQTLPFAVDGVVLMEPLVKEPICGGEIRFDPGSDPLYLGRLDGLIQAVRTGALDSAWTVATIR